MNTYAMITFYAESREGLVCDSTVGHSATVLTRTFDQLKAYGVTLLEDRIDGLSGAALQRWMNAFRKEHKPATVNNIVCMLNPFLRWAHTIYPDTIADFSGVLKTMRLPSYEKMPEEDRPKDKYYSDEDIRRLLEIPKHDTPLKKRDRAVMALFLGSGLRVSELCSLTIGSLTDHGHGLVYIRRKGGAWKTTEVAEFCYRYIEDYLATRPDRDDPKAPLFVTTHGEPCSQNQLYKSMCHRQKQVVDTDQYALGNHVLRHTFVSSVEKIGGGAVARDLANHKSLTITNRYDHSNAQQRRDAVNALGW